MKRFLAALLALTLLLPTALAAEMDESIVLITKAEELAVQLDALAESTEYSALFTSSEAVVAAVQAWGAGDHDAPVSVLMADLTSMESAVLAMLGEDVPDAAARLMRQRLGSILVQNAQNAGGVITSAAGSIARTTATFAALTENDAGLFILVYEDAAPVAVSWYAENGAVSMTATFLPDSYDLSALHCAEVYGSLMADVPPMDGPARSERALLLAEELRALAASDAWLEMCGLPQSTAEKASGFAAAGESAPRLFLEVTRQGFFSGAEWPDGLLEAYGESRLVSVMLTSLVAAEDTETLAAVSSLQTNVLYADETAEGSGMYILLYEEDAPIVVSWYAENGAVNMSASFLPVEGLMSCRTRWEVQTWAEGCGLLLVTDVVPAADAGFPLECIDSLARMVCGDWPALAQAADLTYADAVQMLTGCTYRQPTMTVPLEFVPTELSPEEAAAWGKLMSGEALLMTSDGAKSWEDLTVEPAPSDAQLVRLGVVNHISAHTVSYECETSLMYNDPTLPDMSGGALRFYADGAPLLAVWDVQSGAATLTLRPIPDAALAACQTPAEVQAWLDAEACQVRVSE